MRPGKEKTVLANMWFLKWFYLVTWKGINVKDSNMYIKVQVLKGVQHGKWQVRARHHRASININTIFKDDKHESFKYLKDKLPLMSLSSPFQMNFHRSSESFPIQNVSFQIFCKKRELFCSA